MNGCNLFVCDENVRVLEHRLHVFRVRHHIVRDVPLIELHAFHRLNFDTETFSLFNRNDTVLARNVHSLFDFDADLRIVRRDGRNAFDFVFHRFGYVILNMFDDCLDAFFDAAPQ